MFSSLLKALRKNTVSTRKNKSNRKATRRAERNRNASANRRQYGGVADLANLGTSLYWRPYVASAPDNMLQRVGDAASGSTYVIPPSPPYQHTFQYVSHGTNGVVPPTSVTRINDPSPVLAHPAPYQRSTH